MAMTAIAPCRAFSGSLPDRGSTDVVVAGRCGVPSDATAIAAVIAVRDTAGPGWGRVFPPTDAAPVVSNLNYAQGDAIANGVIVGLGHGSLRLETWRAGTYTLDITAYFRPAAAATAGRFVAMTAVRAMDTRDAGTGALPPGAVVSVPLPSGVPADAVAVAANITITGAGGSGSLTAWAAGTSKPSTTTLLTTTPGQTRAVSSVVGVSADGLQVQMSMGGSVVVDVTGYFTGPSGATSAEGLYVPIAPARVHDSRDDMGFVFARGVRPVASPLFAGQAQVLNVTIVRSARAGFVTVYPANTDRPLVSTVNTWAAGLTVANMSIAPTSAAGLWIYDHPGSHLVVDVTGYFTGDPVSAAAPDPTHGGPTASPFDRPPAADAGSFCAAGLDAASLDAFFSTAHGWWYGADYQRPLPLPDGRVLWLFQDVAVSTPSAGIAIVHNMALVQSGRCFTPLGNGLGTNMPSSWLLSELTTNMHRWFWPLGGEVDPNGVTFHLLMAEMREDSNLYLSHTHPVATYLVDLRADDLSVSGYRPAPDSSAALYGWSVTSDATWSYLYGYCEQQFPPDACQEFVRVARVPRGRLDLSPEYWNGAEWVADPGAAQPVVSRYVTGDAINPALVTFDGTRFLLIEKQGDWFGSTVLLMSSPAPTGPWTLSIEMAAPARCNAICNTYFASLVPWADESGALIWTLSNNRWDGVVSPIYRPTVHTVPRP